MSYRDLLRDSFRITRHNRYLWFFGLFAGTSFNLPFGGNFGGGGNGDPDSARARIEDSLPPPEGLIAIGLGLLLLVLLFAALSVISQGAWPRASRPSTAASSEASARRGERGPRASGGCSASSCCSR
jgi:hypothetical protein